MPVDFLYHILFLQNNESVPSALADENIDVAEAIDVSIDNMIEETILSVGIDRFLFICYEQLINPDFCFTG